MKYALLAAVTIVLSSCWLGIGIADHEGPVIEYNCTKESPNER